MQLVAYGAQDIYLTGNPQITFFKVVYRRHTNFSMESIEQTLNGYPNFEARVTATISRNGDLVSKLWYEMDPSVVCGDSQTASPNPMHAIFKTLEIEIGGQKIDKHYSQWLDIYNELFETSHDLRYAMANGSQITPDANKKTHYIPLRFWFNRNPGLALPLIALQYHEVKINMTLNPVRGGTADGSVTISDAKYI